jgi:two-component system, NarL family, nitrate/nitrite response regulator NarL
LKFLVADDHPLYLEAVKAQLERLFDKASVLGAASLDDVLSLISDAKFDLFLIDFHMPGMSLDMISSLVHSYPDTPLAIISGTANTRDVQASIRAGARGFIPKTATGKYLAHAIELLLEGGSSVPTDILLAQDVTDGQEGAGARASDTVNAPRPGWLVSLTARELEVLKGVARGLSNKEIGQELNLAEVTIKLHLRAVFRKIGARNRAEAAVLATKFSL